MPLPRLLGDLQRLCFDESIIVERSSEETFSFVTDLYNSDKISAHVSDVAPVMQGPTIDGRTYRRTLRVHRQAIEQTVQVEISDEHDELAYRTTTELYGFDVEYSYRFTPLAATRTRVSLTKAASIQGFWKMLTPLVRHLLTRPEHDGQHLLTLKHAVESRA